MADPERLCLTKPVCRQCVRRIISIQTDLFFQDRAVGKNKLLFTLFSAQKIDEDVDISCTESILHFRHIVIGQHLCVKSAVHADRL